MRTPVPAAKAEFEEVASRGRPCEKSTKANQTTLRQVCSKAFDGQLLEISGGANRDLQYFRPVTYSELIVAKSRDP
jgi:hypothetical protein